MRLKAITATLAKLSDKQIYLVVGVATAISLFAIQPLLESQASFTLVTKSQVTLSFVIFLGMWGYFTEWYAKKRGWNKRKSIAFALISTLILFVLLRIGGMQTIFG